MSPNLQHTSTAGVRHSHSCHRATSLCSSTCAKPREKQTNISTKTPATNTRYECDCCCAPNSRVAAARAMRNCWATTAAGAWGCTADDRPVGNWTRDAGMDLERVMLGGGNKLRRVVPSAMVSLDRLGDRATGKLRAADVCGVNEQVVCVCVSVCLCVSARSPVPAHLL